MEKKNKCASPEGATNNIKKSEQNKPFPRS